MKGRSNYNIDDVPSDLRDRLDALVNRLEAKERHVRRQRMSIAASLLLLLVSGTTWIMIEEKPMQQPDPAESEMTPQQAAMEAERALTIFARAVQRGRQGAKNAGQATEEATQKAFETLKKI